MDRNKYSIIGHQNMTICNPVGESKIEKALQLLELSPTDQIIDFGAGKGELLLRAAEKYGAKGTGIELMNGLVGDFENTSKGRKNADRVEMFLSDAKEYLESTKELSFKASLCVGATHAFGGYSETLQALKECTSPGGSILIGEGFWQADPPEEFLEFLGSSKDEMGSHESNVKLAEENGLTPLWAAVTSQDEWDQYEWQYSYSLERYIAENPDDPDWEAIKAKIKSWRNAVLKWGRSYFGFGLYLFRNN